MLLAGDEERESDIRSRLHQNNSQYGDSTIIHVPAPAADSTNLLPGVPASESDSDSESFETSTKRKRKDNNTNAELNSAEALETFLAWASGQSEVTKVIPTFNSTREFININGVDWSLVVGTQLNCPEDHIRGKDRICRPTVSFD